MISRKETLEKALNECFIELYKWAQPSINFKDYIENPELIKETKESPFYSRYYLSRDNFKYIVDSFIEAYNIGSKWEDHIDLLIEYITSEDSVKDKYIPGENGSPGHRGYEPIVPLKNITENSEEVISLIKTCKEFYKKDRDLQQFNMSIYLGPSPNSNKTTVEEYWRKNGREDFTIKDFDIDDIIYNTEESVDEFLKTLK